MQYIEHLPPELSCKPEPYVVLSGLDIEKNQVHRSIWRAFNSSHEPERGAFRFRCLGIDHEYPKPKLKPASSYEWFLPKGILKTGWMKKHLEQIPAVVAVFYDLDWDERHWDEKSDECAQTVETVRSKLAGRDSKLVVVLIQKRAPLPLGEDLNAMERAQALCTRCDLPGKNLFVLSHTNLLYGCITRLEREFHDMAANYYHLRAKKVKSHKDSLNKATHQLLFVRHEFKIAFYRELKQDQALALKHYQQAYNHLLEQRMLDTHLLEIKTVAAFINYKICRLTFQQNASDAIAQFRRHIDFFANLVGMPQLAFEHEAWISRQFEILGDLFQEAVQSSLTALMTQHPGLYYQEAARHAIARRQLCHALCFHSSITEDNTVPSDDAASTDDGSQELAVESVVSRSAPSRPFPEAVKPKSQAINSGVEYKPTQSPMLPSVRSPAGSTARSSSSVALVESSATEKVDGLEFYGQRPWRQGIQSLEPPNPAREREGILALQKAELAVDHSELIIPLLEQTHLQYKRYKAERMKLYPCVLMGSEYFNKGNFQKALGCYCSVLNDFRREKWWSIYTFVLRNVLKCAYLTGQIFTFFSAALELLGPNSLMAAPEKERIQKCLFVLFRKDVPDMQFIIPELTHLGDDLTKLWREQIAHLGTIQIPLESKSQSPPMIQSASPESQQPTTLDVSRLNVCIECKLAFAKTQFSIDEPIQLAVFLRSHAPLPFEIRSVCVDLTWKMKSSNDSTPAHLPTRTCSARWFSPFCLASSDPAKIILFNVKPQVLGQHIKVDAVSAIISYPRVDGQSKNENELLFSLAWRWPTNSQSVASHGRHHRRAASSPSKRLADLNSFAHDHLGFSALWEMACPLSALERRFRLTRPMLASQNEPLSLQMPSFPPSWDLIASQLHADIRERTSGLTVSISHMPPALAREIYAVQLDICNTESNEASQIVLTANLVEQPTAARTSNSPSSGESTSQISSPSRAGSHDQIVIDGDQSTFSSDTPDTSVPVNEYAISSCSKSLPDLPSGEHMTHQILLRCLDPGQRNLHCQVAYNTKLPVPNLANVLLSMLHPETGTLCKTAVVQVEGGASRNPLDSTDGKSTPSETVQIQCVQNTVAEIAVLAPFNLTWQTMSPLQSPISDLVVGEEFILQLTLENISSTDLELLGTLFHLTPSVAFVDKKQDIQLENIYLRPSERATEHQLLSVNRTSQENEVVGLGSYTVRWRRRQPAHSPENVSVVSAVTTTFDLVSCSVLELPVRIRAEIPAFGTVYNPMPVVYILDNQTIYPQEMLIQMEAASNFMFSGQQKLHLRLLPSLTQYLEYVFLPLRPGNVALPRLRVNLVRLGKSDSGEEDTLKLHMEEKMLRQIPTHVFIAPSDKNSSKPVICESPIKLQSLTG
ncbi:unnamed protein product [Calicophoron daubneyi]|uniref:Trafficking protein particle complex subunit 11 n=1 Tax=Calicophoron daubneyi TaxID=300641 RepID=A0AAV2TZG7_CALDB